MEAQNGGKECEGENTKIEACNLRKCPIDCEWSEWTEGECSAACGIGTKINTRTIHVNATNGGDECKGEETEEVECSQFPGE